MSIGWDVYPNLFMEVVREDLRNHTDKLATAIYDGLVARSPVLKGDFRASWLMNIGSPDYTSTVSGGSATSPLAAPKAPSLGKIDEKTIIHITNNKPYAYRLEHGWSKQAPAGMIRQTFESVLK